jgi:DNA methylase.
MKTLIDTPKDDILSLYAPDGFKDIPHDQTAIPKLAKNTTLLSAIERILPTLPTTHRFHHADATAMNFLRHDSVHLIVTSPPYWTLKKYNPSKGQLGEISDYSAFLDELNKVWMQWL